VADLIPLRRDEVLIDVSGVSTRRFAEYLEDLASSTNTVTSKQISISDTGNLAQINALEQRIGSGDFLTSDETGFTADLDTLSVDMDEA